jgi:type VI protein secretion system component Hcp
VLSVPAQGSSAYIRYNLTRVLISSYSVSGSGNAAIETVTIVFERIDPS